MSNSNMLEIIQGLAQAAANAYNGAHDERLVRDGEVKKAGLKRENGCAIMDSRVNDGFQVRFHGPSICILYQSDVSLKEVHAGGFENEMALQINEIKNFLQKEYKAITGKGIGLTLVGDIDVMVQSVSRVRSFVTAKQYYKISRMNVDSGLEPSSDTVRDITRNFLSQASTSRPLNDTRKE